MSLLEVDNLSVEFRMDGCWYPAVSNIAFRVDHGEILALVGESGCGKSVTCHSLARLLPEPPARYSGGSIQFEAEGHKIEVLRAGRRELRRVRGRGIAYIFQEPAASLNPVFRVGGQIAEALQLHRPEVTDVKA
ncbi:MAG: ATP-binding cassette domain-containing protein, partial [Victivallales bacterium]|nr:ATP-binding cassette domain-containing protein [Victivallales bacterium]